MRSSTSPIRVAASVAAVVALCACASAPTTRYYTLLAAAPPPKAGPSAMLIEVLPVRVPAQVDVQELVVRQGGGELARVEAAQWIAPLPDEWRAALSAQLQARLGARDVYGLPQEQAAPVRRVRLVVHRYDAWLDHRVDVAAHWSVSDVSGARITCDSRAIENTPAGIAGIVDGYQRALARIAAEIAAVLSRPPGAAVVCP